MLARCDTDARIPAGQLNDNQKAAVMVRQGEIIATCSRQHDDLIDFVVAGRK